MTPYGTMLNDEEIASVLNYVRNSFGNTSPVIITAEKVKAGHGRVGDATGEREIGPGDVVRIGPGERHWHGAARGASMTHLSVTTVGPPDWQEPVAEAEGDV